MKLYKSHLLGGTMDLENKRIYFYGGIFSQWATCKFTDPDINKTFNCAEQAMMYYKAMTFQDGEAMRTVLSESNPSRQKAIGRTIRGYDDEIWNEVKFDIVTRNNLLKFTQNPGWKELLIFTDGYELVEASPYDKIWGVGLGEDNPDILDKSKWQGENLLGKAIIDAREWIIRDL
jgi:ribA/ribD-fused uncharacterized protein